MRLCVALASLLAGTAGCLDGSGGASPHADDWPESYWVLRVSGTIGGTGPPPEKPPIPCSIASSNVALDLEARELWVAEPQVGTDAFGPGTVLLVWDQVQVQVVAGVADCRASILLAADGWPATYTFEHGDFRLGIPLDREGAGLAVNGTLLASGETLEVPVHFERVVGNATYAYDGDLSLTLSGTWSKDGIHAYADELPKGKSHGIGIDPLER